MHILVTGAAGFLGKAVVLTLKQAGYDVTATARHAVGGNVPCDLTVPSQLHKLLDHVRPEVIVNCAARADFGMKVLPSLYAVNSLAPSIMADWASAVGAYFVQVSGTLIHGLHANNISPEAAINPDSDYAVSKWLAEEMIRASGAQAVILRFGGLYGYGGPEHLGLNRAIKKAVDGHPPVVIGEGSSCRNYLHVSDAASMIFHCIKHSVKGVHLAAGSEVLSISQIMQTVCDVYLPGKSPEYRHGDEANHQIILSSPELPEARPMLQALSAES